LCLLRIKGSPNPIPLPPPPLSLLPPPAPSPPHLSLSLLRSTTHGADATPTDPSQREPAAYYKQQPTVAATATQGEQRKPADANVLVRCGGCWRGRHGGGRGDCSSAVPASHAPPPFPCPPAGVSDSISSSSRTRWKAA
jgi:hypothetical protein